MPLPTETKNVTELATLAEPATDDLLLVHDVSTGVTKVATVASVRGEAPEGGIDELTGDVVAGPGSGAQAAMVAALQGVPLVVGSPASGDVIKFDGTDFVTGPPGGGGSALLYEMPIDTAAFTAEALLRGPSDSGTPSGTRTKSLIDVPWFGAGSGIQAVKLECTASICMWRLNHGITLPAEGYVVEVDVAQYDSTNNYGLVSPLGDFSNPSGTQLFEGVLFQSYRGASNIDAYVAALSTSPYAFATSFAPAGGQAGWNGNPGTGINGPIRMVCEVRRVASRTPADWSMRITAFTTNGTVKTASMSGVGNALSGLNGNPFADIAIGCEGAPSSIAISGLRIYALGR